MCCFQRSSVDMHRVVSVGRSKHKLTTFSIAHIRVKSSNKIMSEFPPCPKCKSQYTYESDGLFICPECFHEWSAATVEAEQPEAASAIKDANGNILNDGDTVIVIKDLPVKGSSKPVKAGTKVKNIKLTEGDHNISCKIDGFGSMGLKSEFVRKA